MTAADGADSAGVPWAGRTLGAQPFAGDDGSADPALAAALAEGNVERVAAALLDARVLVPVVALDGEGPAPVGPHGRPVDTGADMAVASVVAPDGGRALPVFSCLAALATWHSARPVPAEGTRAALAAVQDDCTALLVDPAGPHTVLLPRVALWAVAQGRRWVPPAVDPEVADAVRAAATGIEHVVAASVAPGEGDGVRVVLALRPGLDAGTVRRAVGAVRAALARSELLAERAGSLALTVVPA